MVEREQVIQWLEDGGKKEAARALSQCGLDYEWVDALFEWHGNREYALYDVRIEAPYEVLSQIETTLTAEKEQIESAAKDCLSSTNAAVRSFEWVPKLSTDLAPTSSEEKEMNTVDIAIASGLSDLEELLEDSTMTPQQKASTYIDWYCRVDNQLKQLGVLGDETDSKCANLWRNAESSGFPRDYEHQPSIDSVIRAARVALEAIKDSLGDREPVVGELFPLDVVEKAKGFATDVAHQANGCYEKGWYDACAVMVRRLIEILIIDCFQVHGLLDNVKDEEGNILGLGRLVEAFLEVPEDAWHVERRAKPALRRPKTVGDRAAHGRYQKTRRHNLDKHKESLEIALQQLACIVESGSGR